MGDPKIHDWQALLQTLIINGGINMNDRFPPVAKVGILAGHFLRELASAGGKPVCLAICDRHGILCHFERMDGAPARCVAIACAKACTSAVMECSTSAFHARLRDEKLEIGEFRDSRLTSIAGGVPLLVNGNSAGGIGVSGRKIEEDEELASQFAQMLTQKLFSQAPEPVKMSSDSKDATDPDKQ